MGTFSLSKVKYLVLDEADRLLEGGYDGQLATILPSLPSNRQTLLFTATSSDSVRSVIKSCNNDPYTWVSPTLSTGVEILLGRARTSTGDHPGSEISADPTRSSG